MRKLCIKLYFGKHLAEPYDSFPRLGIYGPPGQHLGAGISWGLFSVLAARASFDPVSSMFFMQLFSSFIIFSILITGGMFTVPSGLSTIGGAFYSGVLSNVVGVLLWLAAQRSTEDVSLITGLLYLVPFLSLFALRVFLGFPISGYAYIGLVCIVGGAAFHHIRSKKKPARSVKKDK